MALRRDAKIELLKRVPLFAACTKGELRRLASIADELDVREGTVLIHEGRIGHEFFVLIAGEVRVSKDGKKLADLGGGDWLGEIALLTKGPRTATATAMSPVHTLVLVDRDFRGVVKEMPSIAVKVLTCVATRLTRDARS
ncbi:MAG: cyclic nucleotide-binding domain-containing protein [Gaiellaceae bacterium]